jgi:hypothetical protein
VVLGVRQTGSTNSGRHKSPHRWHWEEIFPGKIFRYPRGDAAAPAAAQAHGRQLAIPEHQLDWTV